MLYLEHCIIFLKIIQIFKYFPKNIFYISIVLKILWKMEHLLLRSKCSIFHNILKESLTFQRRPKVFVWSKGLTQKYEEERVTRLIVFADEAVGYGHK